LVLNGLFLGWMYAGKKDSGLKLIEENLKGWLL
jgi:hypothetical protein